MMPVDLVIVPKNMKNGIGQRYVQLLHQTEKYRTVTSKQCNGDKFKKCPYTATLVWSIFAKIDKSNIAVIGAVIAHMTQGKIDLRNESGRPMKVKVVGEVSEK